MPLSDPYSSYLDRLARQRAEDELMRSRLGEASEQFGKGLGQWNEALRIESELGTLARYAGREALPPGAGNALGGY